jgi:hypothetical protein
MLTASKLTLAMMPINALRERFISSNVLSSGDQHQRKFVWESQVLQMNVKPNQFGFNSIIVQMACSFKGLGFSIDCNEPIKLIYYDLCQQGTGQTKQTHRDAYYASE